MDTFRDDVGLHFRSSSVLLVTDLYRFSAVLQNLAAQKTYNNLNMTMREAVASRACCVEGVLKCYRHETLETIIDRIAEAEVAHELWGARLLGWESAVTEPWLFLAGASSGAGGQWRRGERDRFSVWPSASTGSHSCRYWRPVLTPAPQSIPRSLPSTPPSSSHQPSKVSGWHWWPLPLLGNKHNGVKALWFSATHTHTRMEPDFVLQTSEWFWFTDLPVYDPTLFILLLWSSWIFAAIPRSSLPFNNLTGNLTLLRSPHFFFQTPNMKQMSQNEFSPIRDVPVANSKSSLLGKQEPVIQAHSDDLVWHQPLYNFSLKSFLLQPPSLCHHGDSSTTWPACPR